MKWNIAAPSSLFDFVVSKFPESSKTSVREWISDGRFLIDNTPSHDPRTMLEKGQSLHFVAKPAHKGEPFKIVYEDPDVVVIDKPAGLLSVAKETGNEMSVHAYLKQRYKKLVFVVHRLDKETSGLLLFARTYAAYIKLKEELRVRKMKRVYEVIVEGTLKGAGIWDEYLRETGVNLVVVSTSADPEAEQAITSYKVIKCGSRFSRVECTLKTGKKHQIRVHTQNSGHPVAGDMRYGAQFDVPRLCLHAKELEFTHPIKEKKMHFTSKPPRLFDKLVPV